MNEVQIKSLRDHVKSLEVAVHDLEQDRTHHVERLSRIDENINELKTNIEKLSEGLPKE